MRRSRAGIVTINRIGIWWALKKRVLFIILSCSRLFRLWSGVIPGDSGFFRLRSGKQLSRFWVQARVSEVKKRLLWSGRWRGSAARGFSVAHR